MELEEFVASTLSQVINGVKAAQDRVSKTGGWINPLPTQVSEMQEGPKVNEAPIQDFEFDIAVTVTESEKAGAKAGISVLSAKLGGEMGSDRGTASVSRIKFRVPVVLPSTVPPIDPGLDLSRRAANAYGSLPDTYETD